MIKKLLQLSVILASSFCFSQTLLQRFNFDNNLNSVANGLEFITTANPVRHEFVTGLGGSFNEALRIRNIDGFGNTVGGNYRLQEAIPNLPAGDAAKAFMFWLNVPATAVNNQSEILTFASPTTGSSSAPAAPQGFLFRRVQASFNSNTTHSRFEIVGANTVLHWVEIPNTQVGGWHQWTISYIREPAGSPVNGYFRFFRDGVDIPQAGSTGINFDSLNFNTVRIGQVVNNTTRIDFDMDDLRIWNGMSESQAEIIYKDAIKPSAATPQTVCPTNSRISNLVATGLTGGTIEWFLTNSAGAPSNTALTNNTDYDVAQNYNGIISQKVRVRVQFAAAIPDLATIPASIVICNSPATASQLPVPAGSGVRWFATATSAEMSGSTQLANGTYFFSHIVNGCESARFSRSVTVIVNSQPSTSGRTLCAGSTVGDLKTLIGQFAPGDYNVYTTATSTPELLDTTVLTAGIYHVSRFNNICESPRSEVNVIITTVAVPTAAASQSFCSGGTVANLQATGTGTLAWFNVATGGTALGNTTTLTTGNYYVSQTISGCTSARFAVSVSVGPVPAPANVNTSQVFCGASTVADLQPSGSNIRWYANATGGTPLAATTTLVHQNIYYVAAVSGICESTREAVEANVFPNTPPTVTAQTFCSTATVADLLVNGLGTITWYATATSTTPLAPTQGLVTGNYFVTQNAGNCESARATVAVTVSNSSTTWSGTSWSNGTPTLNKGAIFNGNFSSSPANSGTTSGELQACSVIVNANSTVTMNDGHNLTVRNAVNVATGGALILSNNASLIQNTAAVNSGNITSHKTKSIRRLDYTYWGAGVTGQNLQAFSPNTLSNRFYIYDESNNVFSSAGIAASDFSPGVGYSVRAPNTFTTSLASFTGTVTGVPNNGNYNVPVSTTLTNGGNGFNLIANPYPSNMSANSFLTANPGAMYFWTSFTQGAGTGNYATYNISGGLAATVQGATTVPNGILAKGQGFIFKPASVATTTVSFTNNMRSASNVLQFFRMANTAVASKIWLNLTDNEDVFSQTLVSYDDNATDAIDANYDAPQINKTGTVLSTVLDNKPFAIQTKGAFNPTDVTLLDLNIQNAGTYKLAIDHVEGIFNAQQNVYLKDNLTGSLHNLSQNAYEFVAVAGSVNNRFELRYEGALSTTTPALDNNTIVFTNNGTVTVKSMTDFDSVEIFDIRGALIFEKKNLNTNNFSTNELNAQTGILMVRVSKNGLSTVKKLIF
jgi:hypothetical protein